MRTKSIQYFEQIERSNKVVEDGEVKELSFFKVKHFHFALHLLGGEEREERLLEVLDNHKSSIAAFKQREYENKDLFFRVISCFRGLEGNLLRCEQ